MAITLDSVYSGSQMTQYNPLPMGFYVNEVACTDAAETIVDDAMSATADVKINVRAQPKVRNAESFDFIISIDGTQVGFINSSTAYLNTNPDGLDFIVPLGTNLKVTGDNQTSATSTLCAVYVLIEELSGTTST
jgi:hypothetical protein